MSQTQRLTAWKLAVFSLPALPVAALITPLGMYLPPFYATEMGLSLTAVGTIFMVARFWDLFTDPLMGVMSDKFPSRWGRRRHWMVISIPLLMLAVVFVMFPSLFNVGQGNGTYLLGSLLFLYIGYTLLNISHLSWGAELTNNYHERSRIQGWREFFYLTGMVLVLLIPAVLEQTGYALSAAVKMASMGWYVILLTPLCILIAVWYVGEAPTRAKQPITMRKAFKLALSNKYMARILGADLLIALPGAVRGSVFVFYIGAVIEMPEWTAIIMLSYFAAGPIAVPLWIRFSRRMEKHKACALGVLLHAIVTAGYLIPGKGDALLFAVLFFVSGVVYAGVPFLLRSITADITDADRLQSGQDRAGLFYAMIEMTRKVGAAVGIGLAYPILDLVGFIPGGENSQGAIDGLRYVYAFIPLFSELLVVMLLFKFPLGQKMHEELQAQLALRDAEGLLSAGGRDVSGGLIPQPAADKDS